MAQSRLEKVGTIFTRVSNLIRTGAMNMNDRPIWYDVYRAFPPAVPPKFDRPLPNITIQNILYKEDIIRAKFHKDMGRKLPATNLKDQKYLTQTQQMIELCKKIQTEREIDLEEAYKEALHVMDAEFNVRKQQKSEYESSDLASTFKEALDSKSKSEEPLKLNMKDIMKE